MCRAAIEAARHLLINDILRSSCALKIRCAHTLIESQRAATHNTSHHTVCGSALCHPKGIACKATIPQYHIIAMVTRLTLRDRTSRTRAHDLYVYTLFCEHATGIVCFVCLCVSEQRRRGHHYCRTEHTVAGTALAQNRERMTAS